MSWCSACRTGPCRRVSPCRTSPRRASRASGRKPPGGSLPSCRPDWGRRRRFARRGCCGGSTPTRARPPSSPRGDFLDFEASPDGKHVAVLKDGPLAPPPGLEASTEFRRARSLRLVDTQSGVSVDPPEALDISTSLLGWSPDSSAVLVNRIGVDPARLISVTPSGEVRDRTPPGVAPDTTADVFGSPTGARDLARRRRGGPRHTRRATGLVGPSRGRRPSS